MPYHTGLISLDKVLGGLRGVVEVYGPESSGKTTLAYHILRNGGMYITTEGDFDPTLAPGLVNNDRLIVVRPRFGEAALEAASDYLPGKVVIDSASMLSPVGILCTSLWDDKQLGAQARMLAFGARMLSDKCESSGGLVVFIQQIRQSINKRFSGPTRVPHGRGPEHFCTCRIGMSRGEFIRRGHKLAGTQIRATVDKNLYGPPGSQVSLDLLYGRGFRESASLLDWAVSKGIVSKKGSWYRLGDEVLGHGRDEACSTIEEHSLHEEIVGLSGGWSA